MHRKYNNMETVVPLGHPVLYLSENKSINMPSTVPTRGRHREKKLTEQRRRSRHENSMKCRKGQSRGKHGHIGSTGRGTSLSQGRKAGQGELPGGGNA